MTKDGYISVSAVIAKNVTVQSERTEVYRHVLADEIVSGHIEKARHGHRISTDHVPELVEAIGRYATPRKVEFAHRKRGASYGQSTGPPLSAEGRWGEFDLEGEYNLTGLCELVIGEAGVPPGSLERAFLDETGSSRLYTRRDGVNFVSGKEVHGVLDWLELLYLSMKSKTKPGDEPPAGETIETHWGKYKPDETYPLAELCGRIIGDDGIDPGALEVAFRGDAESMGLFRFIKSGTVVDGGKVSKALDVLDAVYRRELKPDSKEV